MRKGNKEFREEDPESLKDETGCNVKRTNREGQRIIEEGPEESSKKAQDYCKEG